MCYMSEGGRDRVGVRELRQNLSVYLDRVKAGETLEVTEHGRVVASLGPHSPEPASIVDRMIADGRITPGADGHRLIAAPTPDPAPGEPALGAILQAMRDEDDR